MFSSRPYSFDVGHYGQRQLTSLFFLVEIFGGHVTVSWTNHRSSPLVSTILGLYPVDFLPLLFPAPCFPLHIYFLLKKYSSISTFITKHLSFQVTKRVNLFRLNSSLWDGIDSVLGGTWWTLAQLNSQWAIKRPEMTAIGFW